MLPSAFVGAPASMSARSIASVTGFPPSRVSTRAASATGSAPGLSGDIPCAGAGLGACSGFMPVLPDLPARPVAHIARGVAHKCEIRLEVAREVLACARGCWLHVSNAGGRAARGNDGDQHDEGEGDQRE